MIPPEHSKEPTETVAAASANPFTGSDVLSILRERGWLAGEPTAEQQAWCERAATLLGGHAADREALAELLGLVFHYDAQEILARWSGRVLPVDEADAFWMRLREFEWADPDG